MALVRIPGGFWAPSYPDGFGATSLFGSGANDTALTDADQEEAQFIGRVCLAAGSGSKTFGNSGSKIGWLPGASITFTSDTTNPVYTVGIKSTTIDFANGPPGRATIGKAAFDVYKDLTGGTDTITSTTYRRDAMAVLASGAITVNHGDLIAVCFLLTKAGAAAQSVKVRTSSVSSGNTVQMPTSTLVTSGPTFTSLAVLPNIELTFDDGTIGWLDSSKLFTTVSTPTIGNGVIYGNIVTLPFDCKVDAIMTAVAPGGTTTNFDVGIWSSPLGTPSAMSTVSVDAQTVSATSARGLIVPLASEQSLTHGTAYAVGVRQNSATGITISAVDVDAVAQWQANGLDSNCYAATSTSGAAFSQLNSGARRAAVWFRISQVDTGAGPGSAPARVFTGF